MLVVINFKTNILNYLTFKLFTQEKDDGPLYKFYEVIMDLGATNQFLKELTVAKDITLFAPSNEAWKEPSVQNIIRLITLFTYRF